MKIKTFILFVVLFILLLMGLSNAIQNGPIAGIVLNAGSVGVGGYLFYHLWEKE